MPGMATEDDVRAAVSALVEAYTQAEADGDTEGMAAIQLIWDEAKAQSPGVGT